ncbi:MAG: hypothetical protein NW203_02365 [Hyphomonadaceae bacterium]|nr:hypothetical protein [Hyphomonadaceae bacterium]
MNDRMHDAYETPQQDAHAGPHQDNLWAAHDLGRVEMAAPPRRDRSGFLIRVAAVAVMMGAGAWALNDALQTPAPPLGAQVAAEQGDDFPVYAANAPAVPVADDASVVDPPQSAEPAAAPPARVAAAPPAARTIEPEPIAPAPIAPEPIAPPPSVEADTPNIATPDLPAAPSGPDAAPLEKAPL